MPSPGCGPYRPVRSAAVAECNPSPDLNATIRDHSRNHDQAARGEVVTTDAGEPIGLGDRVATRRNDRDLQVTNRQTWTVVGIGQDGSLLLHGHGRDREVPAEYAARFVELAYATTVHGAQGDTVDHSHVLVGETTGAAAAYVAMTRGRESNTAHLVAESAEDAKKQWIEVFSRDRADLGPAHARRQAIDAIDRYGPRQPPLPELAPHRALDEPPRGARPRATASGMTTTVLATSLPHIEVH